jgi:hypothetical protein
MSEAFRQEHSVNSLEFYYRATECHSSSI